MPERVHKRFDHASPDLNTTGNITKNGKRKREPTVHNENRQWETSVKGSNFSNFTSKPSNEEASQAHIAQAKADSSRLPNISEDTKSLKSGKKDQKEAYRGLESHGNLKVKAQKLWEQRKNLPVWSHANTIRKGLREKDVLLLIGETGSGKSTQVPQILIKEPWCRAKSISAVRPDGNTELITVGGCIAITEPRRVAAISLARRVAEEVGTPLGSASPASTVGYSVRFDNSTSPSTKIKFLTEGMLLQEMLRDPWLRNYSAVLVDEVHERGVNVDLVMGFLRGMVTGKCEGRGGVPLKIGVMSATVNMAGIMDFIQQGFEALAPEENGELNGNGGSHADQESEWSGFSDSESEDPKIVRNGLKGLVVEDGKDHNFKQPAKNGADSKRNHAQATEQASNTNTTADQSMMKNTSHVAVCYVKGRQYPVKLVYSAEPVQDFVDASLRTIFQIHYKEPMPGDILVFLTGQSTVEFLESLVNEYALGMGPELPKLLVLPLFAALPQAVQQKVFQPAPPKTRKVILATNIAETSVTVSGVRFVIDCGKSKIKQFRTRIGLDSLLVKPISKSAAIQRKGRAGREAPGQCYRLYTENDYLSLQPQNTPEILRCDLSQAILSMKARGVKDVMNFPFLARPPREAMEKALMQLFQLKALTNSGEISNTGLEMAKLPLTVSLGRVLLAAAEKELDCVAEVIDIISCLSVENILLPLNSEEKEEKAQAARRELYRREGDHLTLLATVRAYGTEQVDRKAWAEKHFVSHRAMQAVMVG